MKYTDKTPILSDEERTAKEYLESKTVNCNNSTSIFNTNDYVLLKDALKALGMVKQSNTVEEEIKCINPTCESNEVIEFRNRNKFSCQICGEKWKLTNNKQ